MNNQKPPRTSPPVVGSGAAAESPIFAKSYDMLAWLVPQTEHFPKCHRYSVTQRLLNAALDFLEQLVDANAVRGNARLQRLTAADASLDKVRFYLRLAHRWQWLSPGQYQHVSEQIAEIGKLLGGWQKVTHQPRR